MYTIYYDIQLHIYMYVCTSSVDFESSTHHIKSLESNHQYIGQFVYCQLLLSAGYLFALIAFPSNLLAECFYVRILLEGLLQRCCRFSRYLEREIEKRFKAVGNSITFVAFYLRLDISSIDIDIERQMQIEQNREEGK